MLNSKNGREWKWSNLRDYIGWILISHEEGHQGIFERRIRKLNTSTIVGDGEDEGQYFFKSIRRGRIRADSSPKTYLKITRIRYWLVQWW